MFIFVYLLHSIRREEGPNLSPDPQLPDRYPPWTSLRKHLVLKYLPSVSPGLNLSSNHTSTTSRLPRVRFLLYPRVRGKWSHRRRKMHSSERVSIRVRVRGRWWLCLGVSAVVGIGVGVGGLLLFLIRRRRGRFVRLGCRWLCSLSIRLCIVLIPSPSTIRRYRHRRSQRHRNHRQQDYHAELHRKQQ
ncbi:hypothetical protein C8F01DRAFT_1121777 [Mycena amicta]|nr:hypothetical protein C8F01DRAFT_1121777 [Mycena amicta]